MSNVTSQFPLSFLIKVLVDGYEEDRVTVKRKSYIAIESCMGSFPYIEAEKIKSILLANNIRHKYTDRTIEHDSFIAIEVPDMFIVIRLLEDAGWRIKEHVPFFVWQVVCESMSVPEISWSTIREKVGSEIWDGLHSYQKVAVQKIAERKVCYIGDEMGCGKTLESLVGCYYFQDHWPVLVVCPSSLRYTWRSEIVRWLHVDEKRVFIVKASKDLKKKAKPGQSSSIPEHDFLIISYNLLARPDVTALLLDKYDIVVLDEAHYIKSMGSKRAYAALKVSTKASVRILLSGTPFNYPVEMYQQLKVINPRIYPWFFNGNVDEEDEPGKYFYAKRYCKPHKIRFRNREQWVFKGFDRHEELNAVLNTFMIRRKKLDVLTELPYKNRICITLDPLTKKQEKQIADLLKEEKKAKRSEESSDQEEKKSQVAISSIKTGSPEKFMKSFRLANQFKIPHVLNFVKDHILDDLMTENKKMKTLIFMHHDAMREALEECLTEKDYKYFVINGATTAAKRNEYTEDFQKTHKYRIGLLSITAAGVGLTLTAASTVVFTEILFGPDLHLQAEDRAHRLGQKNTVNIFYLIEPKTTDDINFGLIKKKERESALMLDGKLGHMASQRFGMPEEGEKLSNLIMPNDKRKKAEKRVIVEADSEEIPVSKPLIVKRPKLEIKVYRMFPNLNTESTE
jgi:SWI/SNF-related matrix-associated actin-dependent regulator 1 of chromatin subfamily A